MKHPTKWVSYRLLHKTFWVSLSLEGWLKWFHGLSIFFGSKVRAFAGLLGGGSEMVSWRCVPGFNHSRVMPWIKVRKAILEGSQTNLWWKTLDTCGNGETQRPTELLKKKEKCREKGYMCKGFRKPPESSLWQYITPLMARRAQPLTHTAKTLHLLVCSLCYIWKNMS